MSSENAAAVLWPPPLSDASLCIEALEVLASMHVNSDQVAFLGTLCGPPGCGKSTAVRFCAGKLVRPSALHDTHACTSPPMQNLQLLEINTFQSCVLAKPSPSTALRTQVADAVLPWLAPPRAAAAAGGGSSSSSLTDHASDAALPAERGVLVVLDELPALLAGVGRPLPLLQALLRNLQRNAWAGPVLMLATSCAASALPSDWRTFSPAVLHMTPPDDAQRSQVFQHLLQEHCAQPAEQEEDSHCAAIVAVAHELAASTPAFCAGDLAHLVTGALAELVGTSTRTAPAPSTLAAHMRAAAAAHVPVVIKQLQHSGIPCRPVPPSAALTLDSVGGAAAAKEALQEALVWPRQHPQLLQDAGIAPARGILLYGPPGTGKTLLARAAAGSLGVPFLPVGVSDIMRPQVGDSQKLIAQVFGLARAAAPCVLFLDEVQALFSSRRGGAGGGHASAVQQMEHQLTTQLLTEMNALGDLPGVGVVVVAATNAPGALDSALLRPGRLERCIHVGLPDAPAREDILYSLLQGVDLDAAADLREVAARCEGYTGADLAGVVQVARGLAVREVLPPAPDDDPLGLCDAVSEVLQEALVCQEHLLGAVLRVAPSVSPATVRAMKEWK